MENLEKKRKILSGIHETDLEIECLMEDEDLSLTLSREKMLEYSSDFFNQI
jgi:molecular chaperone DnaK (HSP70)